MAARVVALKIWKWDLGSRRRDEKRITELITRKEKKGGS